MSAPPPLPAHLERLRELIPPEQPVFLVGGAVRDHVLGRPVKDLDLAVPNGALELARRLAEPLGAAWVPLDRERGVARLVLRHDPSLEIDLADYRAPTLEDDLRARDLTINALALDLQDPTRIVDPTGGRADLEAGRVRLTSQAALDDDPLRGLRAIRFTATLGFELDETSASWIRDRAGLLLDASAERIRDELVLLLGADGRVAGLRHSADIGLLPLVLPELGDDPRAAVERLSALERVEIALIASDDSPWPRSNRQAVAADLDAVTSGQRTRRVILRIASLFPVGVDAGGTTAGRRAAALRFSRAESRWLARVVRGSTSLASLPIDHPPTDRCLHRALGPVSDAAVGAAVLLSSQPGRGANDPTVASALDAAINRYGTVLEPKPLLDGDDLVALGVAPGPDVGRLHRALVEEQASGQIIDRDTAVGFVRKQLRP